MECLICHEMPTSDAFILLLSGPAPQRLVSLGQELDRAVDLALAGGRPREPILPAAGQLRSVVFLPCGETPPTPRQFFLRAAKAFRRCRELGAARVAVLMDNAPALWDDDARLEALFRLPELVNYRNDGLRRAEEDGFREVAFVTGCARMAPLLEAARACARGTVAARALCNQRASSQTPLSLAADAAMLGRQYGFEVEVLRQPEIERLDMQSFLSVARGAPLAPPALIVMRWPHGGALPRVGLVGKGLVYDTGGYSLKSNDSMRNMFDDMGGAAAVIGAMTAIAAQRLPVNIVGVVAACENRISDAACVPGDVIGSMSGKSIEVTNTNAEGRLTLADALTFAVRREGCEVLADIATLTGAVKTAVGRYAAGVMSNSDPLFAALQRASTRACEKIWRLDLDEELLPALRSPVADLRNTGSKEDGGGSIVAGLFLQAFTESRPWLHIDMASVNCRAEAPAFSAPGATGYGAALLFCLARELPEYLCNSARKDT
jgi:leucyl aminopeptidase